MTVLSSLVFLREWRREKEHMKMTPKVRKGAEPVVMLQGLSRLDGVYFGEC